MLPGVVVKVNKLYSNADSFENGITKGFRFSYHGYYQAVVVFVVTVIQEFYTLFTTERGYDLIYFLQVTSLAEVGDTFDDFIHDSLFMICIYLLIRHQPRMAS